jgi:V-type H+-transporting ATPase subunit D
VARALTLMKAKLAGAAKGHNLLKKKADALQIKFRAILQKIVEVCLPHSRKYW